MGTTFLWLQSFDSFQQNPKYAFISPFFLGGRGGRREREREGFALHLADNDIFQ